MPSSDEQPNRGKEYQNDPAARPQIAVRRIEQARRSAREDTSVCTAVWRTEVGAFDAQSRAAHDHTGENQRKADGGDESDQTGIQMHAERHHNDEHRARATDPTCERASALLPRSTSRPAAPGIVDELVGSSTIETAGLSPAESSR